MSEKFVTQWFYCSEQSATITQKTGVLRRKKEENVYLAHMPDIEDYAKQLAIVYNQLDEAGCDVVNVVPINIGSSEPCYRRAKAGKREYLGNIPFSTTRGAVVVGQRREDKEK